MLFLDAMHKKIYRHFKEFCNQILVNIVLHFVLKSMLIVIMAVRHLQLLRPIFVVHMTIILKPLNTALKKKKHFNMNKTREWNGMARTYARKKIKMTAVFPFT